MNIDKLILIGASTGGPGHIMKIVKSIGDSFDATMVIAQHMQKSYLDGFAKQLDNHAPIDVEVAKDGCVLKSKTIYVLDENYELMAMGRSIVFAKRDIDLNYSPNINLLFYSASKLRFKMDMMCIVLSGIGDDGAKGSFCLAQKGAICINENEESSIVYGMPKAASELNHSALKLDIEQICQEVEAF